MYMPFIKERCQHPSPEFVLLTTSKVIEFSMPIAIPYPTSGSAANECAPVGR